MPEELNYFKHPFAVVESSEIGRGTRVWAFTHVMEGARVGENCNLCDHVFVESNVVIGDRVTVKNGVALWDGVVLEDLVFVGPFAVFTNDKNPRAAVRKSRREFLQTRVCQGASIGANATLICGITIGRYAFVGAGAVVTKDVDDFAIVVGNPARRVGYMCLCGSKLRNSLSCRCGQVYEKDARGRLRLAEGAPVPIAA
jgi:UDP-2-acetamido-3-amino-2,3-dideoxy-glucuronate N-acetyltransferase